LSKTVPTHGRVANGPVWPIASQTNLETKDHIHASRCIANGRIIKICLFDTPRRIRFLRRNDCRHSPADAAIVVVDVRAASRSAHGASGGCSMKCRSRASCSSANSTRKTAISSGASNKSGPRSARTAFRSSCPSAGRWFFESAQSAHDAGNRSAGRIEGTIQELSRQPEEAAAEQDDKLLEEYLGGQKLTVEEITRARTSAWRAGPQCRFIVAAPRRRSGLRQLLDGVAALLPSPLDRGPVLTVDGQKIEPKANDPFSGFVFKAVIDPYAGHLAYVRVISGTLNPDMDVVNATRGGKERIPQLLRHAGQDAVHRPPEAGPGRDHRDGQIEGHAHQ